MDRAPAHRAPSPTPDLVADTLAWIERHLDERLTLARLADRAGLSPYHFSRLFTARMGLAPMAHVRGRRLVRAARRLAAEPDLRLVDLAFEAGFESQEAFTRAFGRRFGVTPGRFRRGLAPLPPDGDPAMPTPETSRAVARLPGLVTRDAFTVAGPTRRFDQATASTIPDLWSTMIRGLPFVDGQVPSWATYGVVWSADKEEGSFDYMAGIGVRPQGALPAGFERKTIPAATYAVFRVTLDGTALHPQMKGAMAAIWGELVPASGLTVADGPDFELYDGRFAPDRPGTVIAVHVPVTT
ncbi:AraC family transcriptional regulator [Methylobacterium sp. 17Sr1-1]|uniref:AraC family transcriptional regulator n=1 Tax=Methylobacterium sp. 17Sr1-1 TaxID=2202826 RepID=UPI000D6F5707|nr:AraC family transcriptional regulator [Methylobacterium sp. 17Sr1-1]AWN53665.1 AraC family transcriptional regulator [Methylobacterium sp. 17Sr1-1]